MHTSPAGGKIEFTARIRYSWKTFRAFRSPRMTGGASIELRESAARYSSEIEPGPPRITFPTKAAAPWYKSSIFRSLRDRYNKFERTRPREKRRFLKKKKKKKKTLRICFFRTIDFEDRLIGRFLGYAAIVVLNENNFTEGPREKCRIRISHGSMLVEGKKGEEKYSILSVRILRGLGPVIPAGLRNNQENPDILFRATRAAPWSAETITKRLRTDPKAASQTPLSPFTEILVPDNSPRETFHSQPVGVLLRQFRRLPRSKDLVHRV